MRVAMAQVDCVLADPEANLAEARLRIAEAAGLGADLVVFPELSLHGYAQGAAAADTSLRADDPRVLELGTYGPDVLVGLYEREGGARHNAAAYLSGGRLHHVHRKLFLPHYRAWTERDHFAPGTDLLSFDTGRIRAATLVCNDAWQPALPWLAAQDGAELLLVPANSAAVDDGTLDNTTYWYDLVRQIARMQQCWVVFVNRVGTENGVGFWGGSQVLDPAGEVVARAPFGAAGVYLAEVDPGYARRRRDALPLLGDARFDLLRRQLTRLESVD
ncbi:nitrilase-related carbon-nitrogen hydrolase [Nocardiopsis nanhaiensis]